MADRKHTSSRAGRWYLTGLGLSIALIGSLFFWLMWRSYQRARHMENWPRVPCVVIASEIEERRIDPSSLPEFRLNVLFGYEWQGAARSSDHVTWRKNPWSSRRAAIEEQAAQYPPGAALTCRVDPGNPDFAILSTDSKAPGYSIWFPALFIVGGLGILIRAHASTPPSGK